MTRPRIKARAPIGHYAKAIVAFFAPALTQLAVDISTAGVTVREIVVNALVSTITALTVWALPNAPA